MQPTNDDASRNVNVPSRPGAGGVRTPDREAAAKLMRQQIDSIYDDAGSETTQDPYHRSHSEAADHAASSASSGNSDWRNYHSAWQSYYQQYYERYYLAQLARRQQTVTSQTNDPGTEPGIVSSDKPELTKEQAVGELRTKLLNEVNERSKRVKKKPALPADTGRADCRARL